MAQEKAKEGLVGRGWPGTLVVWDLRLSNPHAIEPPDVGVLLGWRDESSKFRELDCHFLWACPREHLARYSLVGGHLCVADQWHKGVQ